MKRSCVCVVGLILLSALAAFGQGMSFSGGGAHGVFHGTATFGLPMDPAATHAANVVYTSRANIKNNFVSTGTICTTNVINLDANGNVTGSTSATAPCNVPPGVYPFVPPSLANSPVTLVIPQVVDGGGWRTTLVLTNTTASAATASLTFYQETAAGDGSTQPWTPTFLEGNSTQSLNLAAGGTIFLHTPGTSSTLTEGWGQATVPDGVQIYAVFGTAGGGQGTAPATPIGNHILVPYDNTNGNVTAMPWRTPPPRARPFPCCSGKRVEDFLSRP